MSSATDPICGSSSDIQRPLLPCCLNSRRVPSSFGVSLENVSMKAKRLPFQIRIRRRLGVPLLQLGLVIEQLELAGSAGHEEVDDVIDREA